MFLTPYRSSELSTWSPLDRLASLRDEFNRLFEPSLPFGLEREGQLFSGWSPALAQTVNKANQSLTLARTPASATPVVYQQTFTVTASGFMPRGSEAIALPWRK